MDFGALDDRGSNSELSSSPATKAAISITSIIGADIVFKIPAKWTQ